MASLTSRKSNCPTRPFHVWNLLSSRRLPSKFFSDPDRAHWGVLRLMKQAKPGARMEVLDVMKGTRVGDAYVRTKKSIDFV